MNDEQNGWNTAYTRGTLRRKTDTRGTLRRKTDTPKYEGGSGPADGHSIVGAGGAGIEDMQHLTKTVGGGCGGAGIDTTNLPDGGVSNINGQPYVNCKPFHPTNTDKLVPDGMEPGGSETDWAWYGAWYGAGAIAVVGMLAGLVLEGKIL